MSRWFIEGKIVFLYCIHRVKGTSTYNIVMKALLLIAHGSKVDVSNDEVRELSARLVSATEGRFGFVECAFLELAEPSIPQGVQHCIDAGAQEVFAVPYFLAAGRHVRSDIPAELQKKRDEHPGIAIHLCDHIGKSRSMVELLLELAEQSLVR